MNKDVQERERVCFYKLRQVGEKYVNIDKEKERVYVIKKKTHTHTSYRMCVLM